MAFVPTNSTLDQAIELTAQGKFPYYHPCCKCNKACSMPLKTLWDKRVAKFGSVEEVYAKYVCRNCTKGQKGEEAPKVSAVPEKGETVCEPEVLGAVHTPCKDLGGGVLEPTGSDVPVESTAPPPTRAFRREPRPGDPITSRPGYIGVTVWEEGVPRGTSWTQIDRTLAK